MIDDNYNESLEKEYESYIASPTVREAYRYLVKYAKALPNYNCLPKRQGFMRGFRYYKGSKWVYGFAVNRESLVFYFRKPSFSQHMFPEAEVRKAFPHIEVRSDGEIKVSLTNIDDAKKLMGIVFGKS